MIPATDVQPRMFSLLDVRYQGAQVASLFKNFWGHDAAKISIKSGGTARRGICTLVRNLSGRFETSVANINIWHSPAKHAPKRKIPATKRTACLIRALHRQYMHSTTGFSPECRDNSPRVHVPHFRLVPQLLRYQSRSAKTNTRHGIGVLTRGAYPYREQEVGGNLSPFPSQSIHNIIA